MLVSDYIAQHGAGAVASILRQTPAFCVFNLAWHTPDQILGLCDALGLLSVEDVQRYVTGVNSAIRYPTAFADAVRPIPAINYDTMPTIEWPAIHESLFNAGVLAADVKLLNIDRAYRLPIRSEWESIGKMFPGRGRKHTGSDRHDCDDFTKEFLGWLASCGLGNLAAGFCVTRHFAGTTLTGGHALALVAINGEPMHFLEPQDGRLYPLTYTRLGGNMFADRVEIAALTF